MVSLGKVPTVKTEVAATAFGLALGGVVGLSQLLAASRLSNLRQSEVPLTTLALPVVVGAGGGVAAALLIPTG